jgi:hypothetical protein
MSESTGFVLGGGVTAETFAGTVSANQSRTAGIDTKSNENFLEARVVLPRRQPANGRCGPSSAEHELGRVSLGIRWVRVDQQARAQASCFAEGLPEKHLL